MWVVRFTLCPIPIVRMIPVTAVRRTFCKASTTTGVQRTVIFTGPSLKAKYDEAMRKLNLGLGCHVAGGSLMLLSSSFLGASPLPTAIFAGLLWMQVMSTAKVTELGGWVNLCKNVIQIESIEQGDSADSQRAKYIITTDGSRLSIETEPRTPVVEDSDDLPSLKQLKELGIIHVDDNALMDSGAACQELFTRDDLVVNTHEGMQPTMQAPPGAARTVIPKLAEIYQKRQKAIHGQNKRLAAMIANAPPMEPGKMLDRLGTASAAMGFAVLVLGGGMYFGAQSQAARVEQQPRKQVAPSGPTSSEFHSE